MQEKFNESISKCDILIGLEPKEASFYSLRGRNYFDLKKYGSAVTDLEYSISLKSDDRDLFFLLTTRVRFKIAIMH
ncbi:MAG: hypothetical protein IPG89_20155 [Bacteroidetes bacterium]|nr:hypothetical protein [Bacteroidota bacterium]